MKIFYQFAIALIIGFFMTGCMTAMPISPSNREEVHFVSVDNDVKLPPKVYYMGPGFGYLTMAGGIIGTAIAASEDKDKADTLQKYLSASNIHIDQIVRSQLIQQLPSANLKLAKQGHADANLKIEIKQYGFSIPQGFATHVVPILTVKIYMIKDNKTIWSNNYYADPMFGNMPEYKVNDLMGNPKLIYQAWNLAAQKAIQHILTTLKS